MKLLWKMVLIYATDDKLIVWCSYPEHGADEGKDTLSRETIEGDTLSTTLVTPTLPQDATDLNATWLG